MEKTDLPVTYYSRAVAWAEKCIPGAIRKGLHPPDKRVASAGSPPSYYLSAEAMVVSNHYRLPVSLPDNLREKVPTVAATGWGLSYHLHVYTGVGVLTYRRTAVSRRHRLTNPTCWEEVDDWLLAIRALEDGAI